MNMQGQLTDPKAALKYMTGGKAFVTLVSAASGNRYTYKIELSEKRNPSDADCWFVSLLIGPDNWTNYKYIGILKNNSFRWTSRAKVEQSAPSVKAIEYVVRSLVAGSMEGFQVWHEGKCGRCGHKLTVPESIASGFGPDCLAMVGGAATAVAAAVAAGAAASHSSLNFDGSARQPKADKPAVVVSGVAAPAPVVDNDAEIRRRVEAYKSEAPENYYQDGMLSEKEAFDVAYNMFRLRVERGQ